MDTWNLHLCFVCLVACPFACHADKNCNFDHILFSVDMAWANARWVLGQTPPEQMRCKKDGILCLTFVYFINAFVSEDFKHLQISNETNSTKV